jgi:polyphosphate kinase 2 (PPK2 family)
MPSANAGTYGELAPASCWRPLGPGSLGRRNRQRLARRIGAPEVATKELLEHHVEHLSAVQQLHYSTNRHALLIIFQGMDAAGKDGLIRHVMSGVNPQGCQVFSFKSPSASELEHDFLWRTTRDVPERGHIGIFNRSYYEEVLVVRVHRGLLRDEGLPDAARHNRKLWHERYRSITDLERHLSANGTRIDEPQKNWKFSLADIKERGYWKQYTKAYEECLLAIRKELAK